MWWQSATGSWPTVRAVSDPPLNLVTLAEKVEALPGRTVAIEGAVGR